MRNNPAIDFEKYFFKFVRSYIVALCWYRTFYLLVLCSFSLGVLSEFEKNGSQKFSIQEENSEHKREVHR